MVWVNKTIHTDIPRIRQGILSAQVMCTLDITVWVNMTIHTDIPRIRQGKLSAQVMCTIDITVWINKTIHTDIPRIRQGKLSAQVLPTTVCTLDLTSNSRTVWIDKTIHTTFLMFLESCRENISAGNANNSVYSVDMTIYKICAQFGSTRQFTLTSLESGRENCQLR